MRAPLDVLLRLASRALVHLPANGALASSARRYADRYDGLNNDAPESNGEYWLIRECLAGPTPTVFDVGANEGTWTDAVLERCPAAEVHCFEPSAATFARLEARVAGRARLNRIALGASVGETTLHVFADGSGMNSLQRREGLEAGWGVAPQERSEQVSVSTIDAYCRESGIDDVDLLKIDVEGSELDVLRGAEAMLREQAIRVVQFEYGGCNIDARVLLKDLFAELRRHGYVLHKLLPHELRAYPRYDQRAENFQYANWVALAPGALGRYAPGPAERASGESTADERPKHA